MNGTDMTAIVRSAVNGQTVYSIRHVFGMLQFGQFILVSIGIYKEDERKTMNECRDVKRGG